MIELDLLIIDLGDSCVVHLESGEAFNLYFAGRQNLFDDDCDTYAWKAPFGVIRDAIDKQFADGEKPVPRIEAEGRGYRFYPYLAHVDTSSVILGQHELDSLAQLAGKPLPVWTPKKGEWKRIWPINNSMPGADEPPFTAWRFTLC